MVVGIQMVVQFDCEVVYVEYLDVFGVQCVGFFLVELGWVGVDVGNVECGYYFVEIEQVVVVGYGLVE